MHSQAGIVMLFLVPQSQVGHIRQFVNIFEIRGPNCSGCSGNKKSACVGAFCVVPVIVAELTVCAC